METIQHIGDIQQSFMALNEELEILYCNDAMESLLTNHGVIGKKISEVLPNLESYPFYAKLKNAIHERAFTHFQEYLSAFNLWLEIRVYPSQNETNIYIVDVTEQMVKKTIEKEQVLLKKIDDTELKYRIIAENMTDIMFITDSNYHVHYASPSIKTVLGYEPREIEGKQSLHKLHPEDISRAIQIFNEVLATKTPQKVEYRSKHKSNKWINFEAILTPFYEEDGSVDKVLIVSRDMTDRKKSEKLLRQREQRYRSLFKHNPDAVYSLDLKGNFTSVNDEVIHITGYTRKELLHMKAHDYIKKEDKKQIYQHFKQALQGKAQHFEITIVQKGNKEVDLSVTILPIKVDNEIIGIYGIAKDITEQNKSRRALQQSEKKFRSVVESASDAIIITDHKMTIVSWNKGAEKIFGYLEKEAIDEGIEITFSNEFMEMNAMIIHEFLNGYSEKYIGKPLEIIGVRKSGEKFPMELSLNLWSVGEDTFVCAIIRDISERKRVESELQRSKEKYRHLINYLPEALMIVNNEKLVFINHKVVKLFGAASKDQIYQRSFFDMFEKESGYIIDTIRSVLNDQYHIEKMETRLKTLAGDYMDVELDVRPTIYGGEASVQIILRDITELKKSKELLINAEKLTAAGELAAGIAHEIRNPLTSIKGFIQLAHTSNMSYERYYPIILTEIDRINSIISELLLLSKPNKQEYRKINVDSILNDVINLYNAQAILHDIEIQVLIEIVDAEIIGHESQLKQVLINLLKNGLEAMPDGGVIIIQLQATLEKVLLTIQDHGAGIPKDILPKIGNPFFTTKEKGTGLGLATCFSIIENHRGKMYIESEENVGTTIHIELPRLQNY